MKAGTPGPPPDTAGTLFAGLFGLLIGLAFLKFGNPVILDRLVEMPRGYQEWRAFPWPIRVGYAGLIAVVAAAIPVLRHGIRPTTPAWIYVLLAGWIGWQFVATTASVELAISRVVLCHFVACVICFLLGHFVLGRVTEPRTFWLCLAGGFIGVLGMAFDQRFGGLEETRRMVLQGTNAANLSPEYLARIQSNRVFSTLVYPNALAGAVLLVLPLSIVLAWRAGGRWGPNGSKLLALLSLTAGLCALLWSGSKAGWILAMIATLFLLFHGPLAPQVKIWLGTVFLVVGLTGFGFVYADKLRRGATSMVARFDYWSAGWRGFTERPLLGHGPGTFKRVYARLKHPDSEMAQLTHNDYLQQATDSGFPGFLAYFGFVWGSLGLLYHKRHLATDPLSRAVWIGVATWFAQGFTEFGLYIPATAWCAFALLGWLLSRIGSTTLR